MLSDRPTLTTTGAKKIALDLYSLASSAKQLPGERDQNFHLVDESGKGFVLKISSVREQIANLEFQNNVITHLRANHDERLFPQICQTREGEDIGTVIDEDGRTHFVRLLTFLPGKPLVEINPHTPVLFYQFGRFLGQMDNALQTFTSPIPSHDLQWDFKQSHHVIRHHIKYIQNKSQRELVADFLSLFEQAVLPQFNNLRTSVIHNDANDHNVIVENNQVTGIIDFGDMVHSFTIGELAIGMAYAMLGKADPLTLGACIVRGYHEVSPLTGLEIALLYPLICIRLCVSVSLSAYRQKKAPEDKYLTISEAPAWDLLTQLAEIGGDFAHFTFRQFAGLSSSPRSYRVVKWLHENNHAFQPPLPFDPGQAIIFDLSVGTPEIGSLDLLDDLQAFTTMMFKKMSKAGAKVGIGRYDEARLIYRDEMFKSNGNEGHEYRTIHLGIDLFAEPGTPVFAPLDGKVHSFQNNTAHLDYGPTIILEHNTGQDPFYTLYGHLSLESLQDLSHGKRINKGELIARIGDTAVNGGWPPHLHFQIITDSMGQEGTFPGVALASQRQIWLDICPDPNLIVGLPGHVFPQKRLATNQILEERQKHLGKSLSISYEKPLKIVRGWRQYLYDETGRPYLDGVNNVCHVGHSHPRVVEALHKQAAVLNTNTRYLHDNLVQYAQRLCATLPPALSVCFFVCSGSEANELALRLALAHTRQRDIIVQDGAYHGNTQALIDISPYKFNGPGGLGPPAHVHITPMPDPYRGLYQKGTKNIGERYAGHVAELIDRSTRQGRKIGAFITESLLSCGGQIVLPDNYLQESFNYVRNAGGVCIVDEVQVGFGRVGSHFWGFETQGVVPDIMTMGKPIGNGHPLAAVVTTPEIAASFANGMEYFNTFGGNPVSCAVGMAVLDAIEEEQLQKNALRVGHHLKQGLTQLMSKFPIIGDVRGLGLFVGIEFVLDPLRKIPAPEQASYVVERMKNHGILLSTDGPDHNVIKIKPPLVFSEENADQLVNTLEKILAEDFINQEPIHLTG